MCDLTINYLKFCLNSTDHYTKKAKLRDVEGKHFYSKICGLIVLVLIMGGVFSVGGYSSKVFLLACTSTLVAFSKLLERKKEKEVN